MVMNLQDLFKEAQVLNDTQETTPEVAETVANDEGIDKLAAEITAAGKLHGEAFVNAVLEKLAGSGVPAAGAGDGLNGKTRSKWHAVAEAISARRGKSLNPGDDTSVRAEDGTYKGHGSNTALSGAKGVVNPAKALD